MALTPNDVLNKQFTTTKFKDGYDQDEVDDFLDEVLAEFQRLIAENDGLKSQLGAQPAGGAGSGDAEALRGQLAEAQSQLQQLQSQLAQAQNQLAQTQTELEQTKQAAQQAGLDGMNSAEYLQLARRVHEEHVREGVAKRDQLVADGTTQAQSLVAEAQSTADGLVAEAQQRATSLVSEAQSTADSLRSEAQQQADALTTQAQQTYESQVTELSGRVAELEQSKTALERNVSELQEFERNYRSSLRSHLEAQLSELAAAGTAAVPGTGEAASHAESPSSGESSWTGPTETAAEQDAATASSGEIAEGSGEAEGADESAPSSEQIFDYGQTSFSPSSSTPSGGIPDFGTQRLDTGSQGLPSFGQSTGEQPSAPGFGGN